ncbi:phage holin family protein [Cardinium endosymbiont of Oedothorax gibbosus]|uniref:phage holin family protein n=1 Tax=Cardinium endosymbiont of Oedothorax gibbosus TaxID=931101 RepID=UPI0020244F4B|nr:phage holin family protein [Cardinium endosymbiont of Oedothorax gibbosus]
MVRKRMGMLVCALQHNLKAQAKKIAQMFLLGSLAFILLGLGLQFLLFGLACWLNAVLCNTYLGFLLVAMGCFLMVILIVLMLRRKINNQEVEQGHITDGE